MLENYHFDAAKAHEQANFLMGATSAYLSDVASFGLVQFDPEKYSYPQAFAYGQLVGHLAALGYGGGLATGGHAGAIAFSETGVGIAVGEGAAAYGAGVATAATVNLAKTIYYINQNSSTGGGSSDSGGGSSSQASEELKTISESPTFTKELEKAYGKGAVETYENVLKMILAKGQSGRNVHELTGDLKGWKAMDIPGTGKGRGGGRVIFREVNGTINVKGFVKGHNYNKIYGQ